jgi:LmbE family N-acetylglucosaminyl deacetylase
VRLGYSDSGLIPDGGDLTAFSEVDVDEVAQTLASILVEEDADALTVYDPRGGYGHPDHVQVHRTGSRAAALAGTPLVLEATLDGDLVDILLRVLRLVRNPLGRAAPLGGRRLYTPRRALTHRVDVSEHLTAKRSAMSAHVSQQGADTSVRMLTRFLRLPTPVFDRVFRREWFVEQGRRPGPLLDDIFASLRGTPDAASPEGRTTVRDDRIP